ISNQHRAVRFHVIYATGLIAIGIVIEGVALILSTILNAEIFKSWLQIGGAFVASLSAFPLKEIVARYERADTLDAINTRLLTLQKLGESESTESLKKLDDIVTLAIRTAVGVKTAAGD